MAWRLRRDHDGLRRRMSIMTTRTRSALPSISDQDRKTLAEVGYLHVPGVLSERELRGVLAAAPDGQPQGLDDERLDCLWRHPRILALVREVLRGDFHLQQFGLRVARVEGTPGRTCAAKLHTDWSDPVVEGKFQQCVAIFPLDPFRASNGATRVVPGSHLWTAEELAAVDVHEQHPAETQLVGKPGDAFIMNAHLLHAAGNNLSGAPRKAIFAFYVRNDAPDYNVLPFVVSDALLARLPADAATLLQRHV